MSLDLAIDDGEEDSTALLMNMGFSDVGEVQRALQLASGDANQALSYLTNETPGLNDIDMHDSASTADIVSEKGASKDQSSSIVGAKLPRATVKKRPKTPVDPLLPTTSRTFGDKDKDTKGSCAHDHVNAQAKDKKNKKKRPDLYFDARMMKVGAHRPKAEDIRLLRAEFQESKSPVPVVIVKPTPGLKPILKKPNVGIEIGKDAAEKSKGLVSTNTKYAATEKNAVYNDEARREPTGNIKGCQDQSSPIVGAQQARVTVKKRPKIPVDSLLLPTASRVFKDKDTKDSCAHGHGKAKTKNEKNKKKRPDLDFDGLPKMKAWAQRRPNGALRRLLLEARERSPVFVSLPTPRRKPRLKRPNVGIEIGKDAAEKSKGLVPSTSKNAKNAVYNDEAGLEPTESIKGCEDQSSPIVGAKRSRVTLKKRPKPSADPLLLTASRTFKYKDTKLAESEGTIESLEKERDFYFNKLREVEVLCQEFEADLIPKTNVLEVLYRTEKCLASPNEAEQPPEERRHEEEEGIIDLSHELLQNGELDEF